MNEMTGDIIYFFPRKEQVREKRLEGFILTLSPGEEGSRVLSSMERDKRKGW